MLSSIINNIHSSRYKTNANKKVSNGNHNRNNSIICQKRQKIILQKKWKIFWHSPKKNLYKFAKNRSKTKQKIEQIISIFIPHMIMSDPKENNSKKKKEKINLKCWRYNTKHINLNN